MNKELRQVVYDKYDGCCAYCGDEIEFKDMQFYFEWLGRNKI